MGGRSSSYKTNFVRYIGIAEKMHMYKKKVVGMTRAASEDVCQNMFGYGIDDLRLEEYWLRKSLLSSVEEAFLGYKLNDIWPDSFLYKESELLELNLRMSFCAASDLAELRCQSYKRNLRNNSEMTPRELEQEFHKECIAMAEANEREKGRGRTQTNMAPYGAVAF